MCNEVGINITLRHLNISGLGDISHGISPGIPISASRTNGKHFSTHSKQLISWNLAILKEVILETYRDNEGDGVGEQRPLDLLVS